MRKKVFIVLTILWMGVIFYMSNQPANISTEYSSSVIDILSSLPLIGTVIEVMVENNVAQFVVRKGAHMFSYAMMSVLCFMSMYDVNIDLKKLCVRSVLISFIYACTDEFHQLFIPGRSGEFKDVLIDSTGAFIAILLVYVIVKRIDKKLVNKIS